MTRAIDRDATEITRELRHTEALVDEALMQSSRLMQKILVARQNPDLAADTCQTAIIRLARAQRQLIDGSSDVLRVHAELKKVARELGTKDHEGSTVEDETGVIELEVANAA